MNKINERSLKESLQLALRDALEVVLWTQVSAITVSEILSITNDVDALLPMVGAGLFNTGLYFAKQLFTYYYGSK
jgi:hypothetical protein